MDGWGLLESLPSPLQSRTTIHPNAHAVGGGLFHLLLRGVYLVVYAGERAVTETPRLGLYARFFALHET